MLRGLALIANSKLSGPTSGGRHKPQIIAPADVADENDSLAVRRPRRRADRARHIELFDFEIPLDLHIGLRGNLFGIGDGLGAGEVWAA